MHHQRFFQVSIRTLLILTTFVAIGLAFWTRVSQRAREQRIATARTLALGGKMTAKETYQAWPWLRTAFGEEFFQEVVDVNLNETLATDADLELIGKLRGVKSLSVAGAMPRRCGLMPTLEQNPQHLPSQITSGGIRRLGPQRTMQTAGFAYTPITDAALETIASWPQLESLDLRQTEITSQGVQYLRKLGGLKELDLSWTRIDDDAVPALCQMGSLRKLDIQSTAISGEGMFRLREALPGCDLWGDLLNSSTHVDPDPESMSWKKEIRVIKLVNIMGCLRLFILADAPVTDLHLKDMGQLENVDVIDLRRTKVTGEGVATLQRALPRCKIYR